MKPVLLKSNEMVVKKDDFGFLVREFISDCLRPRCNINEEWLDKVLREWWPDLEEYYQRHIQCDIEVALALDEPPRYSREPMDWSRKEMWKKIIADLRPPKSPFTVKYHCHKCKTENVKLWRGVHGCADAQGHELLCASCLSPDIKVSDSGTAPVKYDNLSGFDSDQINGWLPAIPVGDTYWGYSSVPSQDVEWWQKLPTYPVK